MPAEYPLRVLADAERRRTMARASMAVALSTSRKYMLTDTHGERAYAEPQARTLTPLFTTWQSEVLTAVRMLRRWRYYADTATAPAEPNMPLDGCHCRVCESRR
jgi:hypothetical protein